MSVYEVSVDATFQASHAVRGAQGTMEGPHGHDWTVTATFRSATIDDSGFVVDFMEARDALETAGAELNGGDLNEILGVPHFGASTERVAEYIAEKLGETLQVEIYRVEVTEAPGCRAAYYPRSPSP